jgi:hypothetical protein
MIFLSGTGRQSAVLRKIAAGAWGTRRQDMRSDGEYSVITATNIIGQSTRQENVLVLS